MEESLELILKYPLIKRRKIDDGKTAFEGKISHNNNDYDIRITKTARPQENPVFHIDLDTKPFTSSHLEKLLRNHDFTSVLQILDHIKGHFGSESPEKPIPNHTNIYKKVLYEYSEFTKFFLNLKTCSLSHDLSTIRVSTLDEKHREHFVEINVNFDDVSKETFEISSCDLPLNKNCEDGTQCFKSNSSLTALFDEFLARIEYLQPYYDLMDVFDQNSSILDPEVPKRCHVYRRIWLGENLSIMVTVDPENISVMPAIKVLGPERLVEEIERKLNDNLPNWNNQNDVFQNLLDLLELENFPQKLTKDERVYQLVNEDECSICFCKRLNNKLPEVICKNRCCQKFYHAECLSEWLISVHSRRVFNEICGKCPNCEKTITCPVP